MSDVICSLRFFLTPHVICYRSVFPPGQQRAPPAAAPAAAHVPAAAAAAPPPAPAAARPPALSAPTEVYIST